MKRSLFFTVILFGLVFGLGPAWGQQEPAQCSRDAKTQSDDCDSAVQNVADAEHAMTTTAAQNSGVTINPGSMTQQTTSNTQVARLQSAIASCQATLKNCQKSCESYAKAARAKSPNGAAIASQVNDREKTECTDAIQKKNR